jgi:GTP-binding protein EngB required for normal cell division
MYVGNTNVGKSTLLSKVTGMFGLLNTSNNRETSCLWRFKLSSTTS